MPANRRTAADPSYGTADAAKAGETASAAPSDLVPDMTRPREVDPGPPPRAPVAPPVPFLAISSLDAIARQYGAGLMVADSARDAARNVPTLREPPAVAHYRAEVLAWIDAREAYRLAHGR